MHTLLRQCVRERDASNKWGRPSIRRDMVQSVIYISIRNGIIARLCPVFTRILHGILLTSSAHFSQATMKSLRDSLYPLTITMRQRQSIRIRRRPPPRQPCTTDISLHFLCDPCARQSISAMYACDHHCPIGISRKPASADTSRARPRSEASAYPSTAPPCADPGQSHA